MLADDAVDETGLRANFLLTGKITGKIEQSGLLGPCAYRKSNPEVLMMQSSQERLGNDAANGLDCPRNWRILVQ